MLATEWPPPLPTDPTPAASAAAIAAREAALQAALAAAATKRQQILDLAESAVGITATALTNAQIKALLGVVLWEKGAFDALLKVRPLNEWVDL